MSEGKTAQVECDNCGDLTTADDLLPLDEAPDLSARLDVGGVVPAGECLKCGAFSYIKKAREEFSYEDVFIDDDAEVEKVDGGAWVQAHIWVYDLEEAEA